MLGKKGKIAIAVVLVIMLSAGFLLQISGDLLLQYEMKKRFSESDIKKAISIFRSDQDIVKFSGKGSWIFYNIDKMNFFTYGYAGKHIAKNPLDMPMFNSKQENPTLADDITMIVFCWKDYTYEGYYYSVAKDTRISDAYMGRIYFVLVDANSFKPLSRIIMSDDKYSRETNRIIRKSDGKVVSWDISFTEDNGLIKDIGDRIEQYFTEIN